MTWMCPSAISFATLMFGSTDEAVLEELRRLWCWFGVWGLREGYLTEAGGLKRIPGSGPWSARSGPTCEVVDQGLSFRVLVLESRP